MGLRMEYEMITGKSIYSGEGQILPYGSFDDNYVNWLENKLSALKQSENVVLDGVSGSHIVVWNKKQNRPATNDEIQFLVNGDDDNGQLFLAWNKVLVDQKDKGILHVHIDSGEEDNYEIRYVQ